ncbi:hypothetical protein PsorP6_010887 [Peronosclerospora sorghi]|uniref:Uncharacterized protein n=1 Tax=Peronosclerospora sorghi TaxID=230839 RepID=A0ACC0VUY1_9STRA|nr:hypothetical protein PsorP6_010887 [Peronosclerospora sorghi]
MLTTNKNSNVSVGNAVGNTGNNFGPDEAPFGYQLSSFYGYQGSPGLFKPTQVSMAANSLFQPMSTELETFDPATRFSYEAHPIANNCKWKYHCAKRARKDALGKLRRGTGLTSFDWLKEFEDTNSIPPL